MVNNIEENKYTKEDCELYKGFDKQYKTYLKQLIISELKSDITSRTIQKWLNNPQLVPEKYQAIVKICLVFTIQKQIIDLESKLFEVAMCRNTIKDKLNLLRKLIKEGGQK